MFPDLVSTDTDRERGNAVLSGVAGACRRLPYRVAANQNGNL